MKRIFTIEPEDWEHLREASMEAQTTPIILVAGFDLSSKAYERVDQFWKELGRKYGFDVKSVKPYNGDAHQIKAEPV